MQISGEKGERVEKDGGCLFVGILTRESTNIGVEKRTKCAEPSHFQVPGCNDHKHGEKISRRVD